MAGRSKPAPPPEAPDPVEELAVLFPDVDITVHDPDSGATVALTVREFRFREGLEAQAQARPLIEALVGPVSAGRTPGVLEISDALAEHADLWLSLVARACGREAAWLARLGDADASAVSNAMWTANGSFFVRRVAAAAAATRTARRSPSPAFSTRSSAPDTGADTPISPVA